MGSCRTYLPSDQCELLGFMEALGKVMAKAIFDGQRYRPHSHPFFKYLLSQEVNFSDLEAYDPCSTRSCMRTSESPSSAVCRCSVTDFEGLQEQDRHGLSRESNKREYLCMRAKNMLVDQRLKQLDAIKRFHVFDWPSDMERFNPQDLAVLLCGPQVITPEMVMENIDFESGSWKNSRTPSHVRLSENLDEKGLRRFLKFVTGSPNLPHGGLESTATTGQSTAKSP